MGRIGKNYFKKGYVYDIKEDDIIDLKGDTKHVEDLEADENRVLSLKLTAQINNVIQTREVIQIVPEKNSTKVYSDKQVLIQKKRIMSP